MKHFASVIIKFVGESKPIIVAIATVGFFIAGAMIIYPNERSKEGGKGHLPWIVLGSAISLSAVALASTVVNSF